MWKNTYTWIVKHFLGAGIMARSSISKRSGFTLIELLVVISIIALLISILLPALRNARQSSYRLKCLVQLRALGTATAAYAGDSRGFGPPHSFSHTRTDGQLVPVWNTGRLASNGFPAFTGLDPYLGYNSGTADARKGYYRNRGCPDYQKGVQTTDPAFIMSHYVLGLVGYGGSPSDPGGFNTRNRWFNLDSPRVFASRTMLAVEHNMQGINGSATVPDLVITLFDKPRAGGGFDHYGRHNGGGLNFLYIDGHGSFLSYNGTVFPALPIFQP
jgi:prepilin-type N-terminal cleavage/methylation domain-containing protein/prepilin-type processing-associated H-X9-DG protein